MNLFGSAFAFEMRYVMCGTTETRFLVPAAVFSEMTVSAIGLLFGFRRILAASELISNNMLTEGTTFRWMFMGIVLM